MKHVFKIFFGLLIFLSFIPYAQEYSNNSLFVGSGVMAFSNKDSFGKSISVGYQKDVFGNRLRVEPTLTLGAFSSKYTTDVPDIYFTSTNLKCNLVVDVVKIKAFSLIFGSGISGNIISGYNGGGGWFPSSSKVGYFEESNVALNGLLGFRVNPSSKRWAYELLLVEGAKELKGSYGELSVLQFRLIFKLK